MRFETLDPTDRRLLDDFQRGFPCVSRPFAVIAERLGVEESEVLERLHRLREAGVIARIGGVRTAQRLGASTLAALKTPEYRTAETGAIVAADPGVNHCYLREGNPDLWFVITGADRAAVSASLARIERATGCGVVDLPLVRSYHIDLGFSLSGRDPKPEPVAARPLALEPGDTPLVQALCDGLEIVAQPWRALAGVLGRGELELLVRIGQLLDTGVLSRLGVVVRHRALGWTANAMVCFSLPEESIDAHGARLARQPGVTLCYRRRPDAKRWPYPLFCMIHARSRDDALSSLADAIANAGLEGVEKRILFSTQCFLQRGARVMESAA